MSGESSGAGGAAGAAGGTAGAGGAPAAPAPGGMVTVTSTSGGAPAAPAPAVISDWTSGLNDHLKGYVQSKGFKDPGMVLDSYVNLEKLMGGDKNTLLRIPQAADAPEWAEVYHKLGRPSMPGEYAIEPVANDPSSKDFTDWAKKSFHDLGLSRKQAESLATRWNEYTTNLQTTSKATYDAKIAEEDRGLRKDWGLAYDQNIQVAKRGMAAFGLTGEDIDNMERAMGFKATMKFVQKLGAKVGEDVYITGGQVPGALTPEMAKNKINMLKNDRDFVKRYAAGGAAEKEEMQKLHMYAYPELVE